MTLFARLMLVVGLGLGTLTSSGLDWAIQTRPAEAESTLAYRGSGRGPLPKADDLAQPADTNTPT